MGMTHAGAKRIGADVQPLRVVILSRVKRNPYVDLLCAGLRSTSPDIEVWIEDQFSLKWMWCFRDRVDILHLHWLELFFVYPTWWLSVKRWVNVFLGLALARLSGIGLVYTMHNVWQHEGKRPFLVWLGNVCMMCLAQTVHVHDQGTAEMLTSRWRRRRGVQVIAHGHYARAYANTCTREQARAWLGVAPDTFVYLFLGRVRPYKGIEELVAAYAALQERDSLLLIAGEAQEPSYAREIQELCSSQERVELRLTFVGDDELQYYFGGSDVCVLPYRRVTTSGAGILALSFATPILAPRMGCFQDLVGDDERGLLYEMGLPTALTDALRRVRDLDMLSLREACRAFIEQLDWERVAGEHFRVYAQMMGLM